MLPVFKQAVEPNKNGTGLFLKPWNIQMLSFFHFHHVTPMVWKMFRHELCSQKTTRTTTTANNCNKTTKERERDKGGPFYQPYTLNNPSLSSPGSHGGVLRSQQQCFGKGETMGVGLPSGWAAPGEAWDPSIVWASVGGCFSFQTCLVKRMKAPPKRRSLLKFSDVFFFWEVEAWKTSTRCWLCNPIWYFVAASCLLARRTLCAVVGRSVGSVQ